MSVRQIARRRRLLIVPCLLALAALLHDAVAEESPAADPHAAIETWSHSLDEVAEKLADPTTSFTELQHALGLVTSVREAALAQRRDTAEALEPARRELDALGPPPKNSEPPDTAEVAALRGRLQAGVAARTEALKQIDVIIARTQGLEEAIRSTGRAQIAGRLFTRGPSPLNPAIWPVALAELSTIATDVARPPRAWWTEGAPSRRGWRPFAWVVFVATAVALLSLPPCLWLLRRFGRDPAVASPSLSRRTVAAVAEGVGRAFAPCAAVIAFTSLLREDELVDGDVARLVTSVARSVVLLVLVIALARAALPARAPAWRLATIGTTAARVLRRRLAALAALVAGLWLIRSVAAGFGTGTPELFAVSNALFSIPFTGLLLLLLPRRLWQGEAVPEAAREAAPSGVWSTLHLIAGLAMLAIPACAFSGFSLLALEIARSLVVTGLVLAAFVGLRAINVELLTSLLAPERDRTGQLRDRLGLGDDASAALLFWLRLVADNVLALAALIVWLLLMRVPPIILIFWARRILEGVRIGDLHISTTDIVLALLLFVAILGSTQLVRRWLETRFLPQTQLGLGAQQALSAGIHYVGLLVGVGLAIATLGLDLSSLALVAGALSVGIGFGLQNVVNNFVSGLIMVLERPIKVGDWVGIAGHEGIVKRINVRATEIETFQRSTVIVPNSAVLSSAVVNWTHRDKFARVEVAVGVAYGSDVEKVRELLLACARAHPEITSIPAPQVLFTGFGASSLDFEVRAFVANNDHRVTVMSDLRFAIDRTFREHGIEIPFSQHDLHLKDIERLEQAIAGRPHTDDT